MFSDRSKFREQFLKRNIPVKLFQSQTSGFRGEELLKKFNFAAMSTQVDGIKFCEQLLKRTSQGTFLPSLVPIGPAVWEKMFKEIVDDA